MPQQSQPSRMNRSPQPLFEGHPINTPTNPTELYNRRKKQPSGGGNSNNSASSANVEMPQSDM